MTAERSHLRAGAGHVEVTDGEERTVRADEDEWLVERFEEHRPRMRAVAARMLGSASDADEAVQETWIRFQRSDIDDVDNLGSWLTTVVSRVCLNVLESRRSRPVLAPEVDLVEAAERSAPIADPTPEDEAVLAESVGLALLVVLDTLSAGERVALVLHDMFGVPFDEIARILGRSPDATRQLASRARRRVRGGEVVTSDRLRQAALVDAFLGAARRGDFEGLIALLDPDVVMTADAVAAGFGVAATTHGADDVSAFARRFRGLRSALADGAAAAAWVQQDQVRVIIRFVTNDDRIERIELVADPAAVAAIDLVVLDPSGTPASGTAAGAAPAHVSDQHASHEGVPMSVPTTCANCHAPLPADQPADNRYCATCTAAWTKG